nr:hypothetical protein [Tanacetum cinerariifolium]
MPVPAEGQVLPPDVLNTHTAWVKASNEIASLMLMTMDPCIQKNLKHLGAYDMLKELKTLYAQQADQECLDQEKSSKNQKKKPHKAAKGNQGKGKAKMGYAHVPVPPFAPKPKNPPTSKKDNPAKDAICHQCGEVGHWRRNYPIYLAELMKKKKISQGASTLGEVETKARSFKSVRRQWSSSVYAVRNKRAKLNLDSALLWHCRFGHTSKKRMEKLQHDGLLDSINIKSFEKCVSCMSGKMARKLYSHQVERATDLLGLIHTDVYGPFKIMSRHGAYYFVTFTDNFSLFQKEVENQLGKTIKSLRSDYKERRNRTLLDMVRSMMSQTTLRKSFWDYALESAACILNIVLTKKVDKTPYEVWYRQAPKLSYLKVWGCEALVKHDTLTKPDKLEPRSIKCIFVRYPKETMGYSFYYPPENKVFVSWNAGFLENGLITQEASGSLEDLEIIQEEDTHLSLDTSLNHEEDDQEIDEPQIDINPICRDLEEPANYKVTLLDLKSDKWLNAMNVEMQSMKENEVWELVDLPPDGKLLVTNGSLKKRPTWMEQYTPIKLVW